MTEAALLLVVDGEARIEARRRAIDAGAGELFRFDPDERHAVRPSGGARLLLTLAPWPGDGHYRGERPRLSASSTARAPPGCLGLPAPVGEAVDRVRERDEERPCRATQMSAIAYGAFPFDAENEKKTKTTAPRSAAALERAAPRRRLRRAAAAAAPRGCCFFRGRGFEPCAAPSFGSLELFRGLVELVALAVDVDELVVVPLRLQLAALLLLVGMSG